MLFAALGVVIVIGLVVLPSLWVRWEMRRHADERPDLPGTGGELARHLLDEAGLHDVKVERADDMGDHYDPIDRAVRLSDANLAGRSVTAVAIAAHEVAHAMQHAEGNRLFDLRTTLATHLVWINRAAIVILLAAPILLIFVRSPALTVVQVVAAFAMLGIGIVFQLLTLPVELDASFRRALPILQAGRYIEADDIARARKVLRAAAYT